MRRVLALKIMLWVALMPISVLGLAPWLLASSSGTAVIWKGDWLQWLGLWLVVDGIGLLFWCVGLFAAVGQGTPWSSHPPKRFVATGPYRFVRNPMALAIFLVLAGETLIYQSWPVFLYTLTLIVLGCLAVRYGEEPQLKRRFGPLYCSYKQQVPGWIPRTPFRPIW